jgi:phage/plasmid-like protein (TIGR03299 family)
MAHLFDSGMFVRVPAWHKLGNVLSDWPGTFDEARKAADLTWDVETTPVYIKGQNYVSPVKGWQAIQRTDNKEVLSIQQESYAVISNTEFGNIIEYVLEENFANLKYETLVSLKGGRQIVATMYLDEPLALPGDPSRTFPYINFVSRHDGAGGLRIGPTAVRVVCANTLSMAEKEMNNHKFAFTIRHTANWADRVNEAKTQIQLALGTFKGYEALGARLMNSSFGQEDLENFLDQWLPYSTAQTDRQRINTTDKRNTFTKLLYQSPTCEGIEGNKWGALQAAIELSDHFVQSHSVETQVMRQLGKSDPRKTFALSLLTS